MTIEVGTRVYFPDSPEGLVVENIRVSNYGTTEIYFENGTSAAADVVFEKAEAWA